MATRLTLHAVQVCPDNGPQQQVAHLQLLGSMCSLAVKLCELGFFTPSATELEMESDATAEAARHEEGGDNHQRPEVPEAGSRRNRAGAVGDLRRLIELTLDLLLHADVLKTSMADGATCANAAGSEIFETRRRGDASLDSAVAVLLRMLQLLHFAFDVRLNMRRCIAHAALTVHAGECKLLAAGISRSRAADLHVASHGLVRPTCTWHLTVSCGRLARGWCAQHGWRRMHAASCVVSLQRL
jgi:hypothetical protein